MHFKLVNFIAIQIISQFFKKRSVAKIIFIQHYLTTFSNLVEAIYEKKLMTEPNHLLWQMPVMS